MRTRTGFTLPEAMLSMVTFSLASMALFQLMIFGMRTFQRSDGRSATQRELLKVSQRLIRELAPCPEAGAAALYPSGSPALGDLAFSFTSPCNEEGKVELDAITQGPIYAAKILYYRNVANDELMRFSKPESATAPVAELASELRLTVQSGQGRRQMKDCTGFQLLSAMDGVPHSELRSPWIFCLKSRSPQGQLLELRFLAHAN